MKQEFVEFREIVERIKDIVSNERDGFIYDTHIAKILNIKYSTLKKQIDENRIPFQEVAIFCCKRGIVINHLVLRDAKD